MEENTETHLELRQTSAMELFCENSQQLEAIRFFKKKALSSMLTGF